MNDKKQKGYNELMEALTPKKTKETSSRKKKKTQIDESPVARRIKKSKTEPQGKKITDFFGKSTFLEELKENDLKNIGQAGPSKEKVEPLPITKGKPKYRILEETPSTIQTANDSSESLKNTKSKITKSKTLEERTSTKKITNVSSKSSKKSKSKIITKSDSFELEFPSITKPTKGKGKGKGKKTLQRSASFEKYGITLPSYQDIKNEQQNLQDYKIKVESLCRMADKSLEKISDIVIEDLKDKKECIILDCFHLDEMALDTYFKKNKSYMDDIIKGKIKSQRHDLFHGITKSNSKMNELTFSTSMITFNFDQKDYLLTLLEKEFDPEDKMNEYIFKVLLPELCLRIFMEEHNMDEPQANDYLETRPVD